MPKELTPEQTTQGTALRRAGYSIRDIAAELGVTKWAVERMFIKTPVTPSVQSQAPSTNPVPILPQPMASQPFPNDLVEREKKIAEAQQQLQVQQAQVDAQMRAADEYRKQTEAQVAALQTRASSPSPKLIAREQQLASMQRKVEADRAAINVKINELNQQQKQINGQKQGLSREALALDRQRKELAKKEQELEKRYDDLEQVMNSLPDERAQRAELSKRSRKEKLVERHNYLVQELLENCEDCRWTGDEVDDYLERAESLKDSIVAFCQENGIDPTGLLIYEGLIFLIADVDEEQADQTSGLFSGTSVRFDYGSIHQAKIRVLLVKSFEDAAPEGLNMTDDEDE